MIRLLGLGNEILADDAFGIRVAQEAAWRLPAGEVEVVFCSASGFHLLDYLLDVRRLVVVDTVVTGSAEPGTIYVVREGEIDTAPAGAAHGAGLFDALALARRLGLPAAEDVVIIAVEAADCLTLGGPMHPAVEAAIPRVLEIVQSSLAPALE